MAPMVTGKERESNLARLLGSGGGDDERRERCLGVGGRRRAAERGRWGVEERPHGAPAEKRAYFVRMRRRCGEWLRGGGIPTPALRAGVRVLTEVGGTGRSKRLVGV